MRRARRNSFVDWGALVTGILCLVGFVGITFATATAAIHHYGWLLGLLIGWTLAPIVGAAGTLVIFLWMLPLQAPPRPARQGARTTRTPPKDLSISVIMPVYNGEHFLRRSLPPLAEMLRRGEILELLVADDGSTDGSAEIAASYGATVVPSGGRLGPGGARNVAAQKARGKILWFVDADVVVQPGGPARIRGSLVQDGVVAVFGSYDDAPPERNFSSQYKNLIHHYHHQVARGAASTFWSGCGAVTRDAFLGAGGFDAEAYPMPSVEDVELGYRLREGGGEIRIDRELLSAHLKRWTMPEIIRTDILRRAVPWARLIIRRKQLIDDLNISEPERLRAALAATVVMVTISTLLALTPLWVLPVLALTAATTNWPLFRLFYRRRGVPFAIAALAFHQLYYVYSTCAFLLCWMEAKVPRMLPGRRREPQLASSSGPAPRLRSAGNSNR